MAPADLKPKPSSRLSTPAGHSETPTWTRPEVEHIIDDHAGTVLETEAPAPGLTRDEELRVTRVYEEIISASSSGNDKKKKKKPAKAEEGDGDEDNAAVTAAFEETGTEEKGEEEAEGKVSESQADADATANTEGEGGEEKDAGDEPAAEPPKTAAAPASGAAGGEGLSLDDVRTALTQLDLTLDDEQFERYVVKFLVSHGLDPSRDSDDGTAGPRLELDGFLALVSVVRTPGHAFGGLLRKAAARADDEKVRDWVCRGCNPLGYDGGGFTALHYAAQGGHTSTMTWLLEWAQLDTSPPEGFLALLPSVVSLRAEKLKEVKKAALAAHEAAWLAFDEGRGPEPSEEEFMKNETKDDEDAMVDISAAELAAMVPCNSSYGPYFEEMLEAKDTSGWTPLMVACAKGMCDAAQLLIDQGANVEAASVDHEGLLGRTAMHWAAAKGKEDAVALLHKAGADANVVDASGWTPLHCCLMHGHVQTAAALVKKHKADYTMEDNIGKTAEAYCSPEIWAAFLEELHSKGPEKRGSKTKPPSR